MANNNKIVIGEDLPEHHVRRLIELSRQHTAAVNANRIEWPDPATVDFDNPGPELEFDLHDNGFLTNELGVSQRKQRQRRQRRGGNRGGKGANKGGGQGKPKLPNPSDVLAEVKKSFAKLPYASTKGNVQTAEFNAEFGDSSKARYFKDAYVEMFSHFHIVYLSEVDAGFVADVAQYLGYAGYCSTANTRAQAVGFLVHPRFQIVGQPIEYMQVASVQGIPDLRPAYRIKLKDTTTGEEEEHVVVHLKSMRGGPKATAAVRYKQLQVLEGLLGANFDGMVAGDMNFILDDPTVTDGDPLKTNGYSLIAPNDHTATQSMGSRIDGYFGKGNKGKVKFYQVRAYWRHPKVTRAFSDHALTCVQRVVTTSQLDATTPNAGCPGGLGDSDFPVDATGAFSLPTLKLMDFGQLGSGRDGALAPKRR